MQPRVGERHDARAAEDLDGAAGPLARLAERLRPGLREQEKERKKTDNPREGWEDGTPPPHRDFKERCVVR